jgi:hypothetical protein
MFPKADIHPVVFDEIYVKEVEQAEEASKKKKNEKMGEKTFINPLENNKRPFE